MRYLDSAATTAVRREVLEAMWPYLTGTFGNPSSPHSVGEPAAAALTGARRWVAEFLGCRANEVVFTSGGTEAANLAVKGIALADPRGRHVVTSTVEHPAVAESCDFLERQHGFDVTRLPVDADGLVDPDDAARAIASDTTLCTVMLANNEVGTVQPVEELAAIAHERGVPMHTDAVQAAGLLDLRGLGVDAISISGHKLGAPKGIGALFVRGRVPVEPVVHGGGQEQGLRSGTENVAGAVGLATAVRLTAQADISGLRASCDRFIGDVQAGVPDAILTGHRTRRLPNHASFCFPGTSGESVLLHLEQDHQIICSSGSACAAGSDEPSPVLLAMGLTPEVAGSAVRFTVDGTPGEEALDAAAEAVTAAVGSVRGLAGR